MIRKKTLTELGISSWLRIKEAIQESIWNMPSILLIISSQRANAPATRCATGFILALEQRVYLNDKENRKQKSAGKKAQENSNTKK